MKSLIFTCFFFLPFVLSAQAPPGFKTLKDTAAFKQKMESQSKLIHTMESNFSQEKYLSVMSEKIITNGHFYFKKTNMLRWEYTAPYKYVIAINKDKMLIKDNNKITRYDINSNKLFKSINEMMINTVQGNLLNNKDYKAAYYENDKNYLVELSPVNKATKDFLKYIYLFVDKTDYSVVKVKLTEPGDDYTTIDFTDRKSNQEIADEKFTVK